MPNKRYRVSEKPHLKSINAYINVTKDRFPDLIWLIQKMEMGEGMVLDEMESALERMQNLATVFLRRFSPENPERGMEESTTGHEDHTPIATSWRSGPVTVGRPNDTERWLAASIYNDSGHAMAQATGTAGYPGHDYQIPAWPGWPQPKLWFWIGPPLRWEVHAQDYGPGWHEFKSVLHPGFGPWGGENFVEKAAREMEPVLEQTFQIAGQLTFFRPLEEFFDA